MKPLTGRERAAICVERRRLLGSFGLLAAGLAGSHGLSILGCAPPADPRGPRTLSLAAADLPVGRRLRVVFRGLPVEVRRDESGVAARSLICTHFGCEIRWRDDLNLYRCPCHEGLYDTDGRPIAGPPVQPLPAVPARLEGDRVILGD